MKIEPVGVERDRQIAEIRGDAIAMEVLRCTKCGREPYNPQHKRIKAKRCCQEWQQMCGQGLPTKPHSTDISAAMELLDDMRYEYAEIEITHIRNDEQWLIRPFKEDEDADCQNPEFEVREPTLQGAISEAWLRHKGGDNG